MNDSSPFPKFPLVLVQISTAKNNIKSCLEVSNILLYTTVMCFSDDYGVWLCKYSILFETNKIFFRSILVANMLDPQ